MARYRVRDVQSLRDYMSRSERIVPHSVRSLAERVGANRSTIGFMLSGERPLVDEKVAEGVAEALGAPLEDLFLPEPSQFRDGDNGSEAHEAVPSAPAASSR
jgi:transcriptional regulator with XRE-family HTH domain